MGTWHDTLTLKDVFDEDDSDANVGRIAMIVHVRLTKARDRFAADLSRRLRRPADLYEYDVITDEFLTCGEDDGPVDYFNAIMDNLYNWADDHRVWID